MNAWREAFDGLFAGGGANWWPLGIVTLQRGFLNHAFVAERCGKHSAPVEEFARIVAEIVIRFMECAQRASVKG